MPQIWSLIESGSGSSGLSYARVRELQLALVDARASDRCPDTFLFLEHRPTITRGRGLQYQRGGSTTEVPRQMPLSQLPPHIAYELSERGGDLTYHGPGQLVIYPIVKLDGHAPWAPHHDVSHYLRWLESWVADWLTRHYRLECRSRPSATGVWINPSCGPSNTPALKKIASIGISIRRWVTYHGVAINVVNDLEPFQLISPCGFEPSLMTRLQDQTTLLSLDDRSDWRAKIESELVNSLTDASSSLIVRLTLDQAWAQLNFERPALEASSEALSESLHLS